MTRSVIAPILYWGYWANVLYILGMFGYLLMDTLMYLSAPMEDRFVRLIYTFLAVLLVIDAILYSIDWYMYAVKSRENVDQPIHFRAELIASVFHHLGSYAYLIGALIAFHRTGWISAWFLFNFLGSLAFLFESAFTFLGWIITLKKTKPTNPKFGCSSQVRISSFTDSTLIFSN